MTNQISLRGGTLVQLSSGRVSGSAPAIHEPSAPTWRRGFRASEHHQGLGGFDTHAQTFRTTGTGGGSPVLNPTPTTRRHTGCPTNRRGSNPLPGGSGHARTTQ